LIHVEIVLMQNNLLQIGLVKWFDRNKGFGIIETFENKEFFLHASNIELSDDRILIATPLIFEIGIAKQDKTTPAINCRIPSTKEDFKIGLSLIGKKRELDFDVTARYKSTWGNPYSKREKRTYDILNYFFHKILCDKQKSEILDLFRTSFASNYQRWNQYEIIDYYKITKDSIGSLKLNAEEFELSEYKPSKTNPNYSCQFILKKELIDYYNSLISDLMRVILWQNGELEYFSSLHHVNIFGIKESLPFDENLLLKHADIIEAKDLSTLKEYKVSQSTYDRLSEIVNDKIFAQSVCSYDDLKTLILNFEELNPINQKRYFDKIKSKIPEDVLFDVWYDRKVFIDTENKEFLLYCPSSRDYKIPIDIIERHIEVVDLSLLMRLSKVFNDSEITRFLLNSYNNNLINEKNFLEILETIKGLSEEVQIQFIEKTFDDLTTNYIEQLFEKNLIWIANKTSGTLLNYSFKIDDDYAKSLIESIANASTYQMSIETKISAIKVLEPERFEENLYKLIPKAPNHALLSIYDISPNVDTFNQIHPKWSFYFNDEILPLIKIAFKNNYLIPHEFWLRLYSKSEQIPVQIQLKIVKRFANEITIENCINSLNFNVTNEIQKFLKRVDLTKYSKDKFLKRFRSVSKSIAIPNLISLAEIFHKWDLPFDNKELKKRLSEIIHEDEFIALLQYLSESEDEIKIQFKDSIIAYIKTDIKPNDPHIVEFIPLAYSSKILEALLSKCTDVIDPKAHLESLRSSEYVNELPLEFAEKHLAQFVRLSPIEALEFILDRIPNLYNKFASEICLEKASFISYLKLLFEKSDSIIKISEGDHDLHIICLHYCDPANEEHLNELQSIFVQSHYSFQIDYVKFLCFLVHKHRLKRDLLLTILEKAKLIQLSALLLQQFISRKISSRDILMDIMNSNLKNHFKLLQDVALTEEELTEIFTLDDLVKPCSGRKKWKGLTYWKQDNIVKWYTEGNHRLVYKGNEGIFCEGRFWLNQPFYYSNNKHTEELYDFFWCRNDYCARVNDSVVINNDFDSWTLNEINEVFDINLDRLSFTYVAGWMNRMKSIFDRLKCNECGNFLRPKHYTPKKLGYYAVPLFNCINDHCSLNSVEIRFTHCIGCGKILDSRECKTCSKCNWLICDDDKCNRCGCGSDHNPIYAQYQ
jgi:hypothetical protein